MRRSLDDKHFLLYCVDSKCVIFSLIFKFSIYCSSVDFVPMIGSVSVYLKVIYLETKLHFSGGFSPPATKYFD